MRVILDVLDGPRKGRSFVFDRHETFIVGRSRHVHCPMPEDVALSRDHFLVEVHPPLCELRDLGSTNGTYLNNVRVDRARLNTGDLISAGQSVFRVQVESAESLRGNEDSSTSRDRLLQTGIRCTGCGAQAPPNLTILGGPGSDGTEAVEWWCGLCRSEASALPQLVPHYTTLRELGRGAMGVVYQGRHNTTGQMVALKLIMPETATTRAAIDRFLREMSVNSQLSHPNIVE